MALISALMRPENTIISSNHLFLAHRHEMLGVICSSTGARREAISLGNRASVEARNPLAEARVREVGRGTDRGTKLSGERRM